MALPATSDFTGSTITEAQFKTAISDLRAYLATLLGTDGVALTAQAALGSLGANLSAKTGAYTVVSGDIGRAFTCTGTWTLSLTASATLGAGFTFGVVNTGSGTITIDPAGSELINGAATYAVPPGGSGLVACTGTGFVLLATSTARTIVLSGDVSSDTVEITGSGNVTISNTAVADDSHNHSGTTLTTDSIVAGTKLKRTGAKGTQSINDGQYWYPDGAYMILTVTPATSDCFLQYRTTGSTWVTLLTFTGGGGEQGCGMFILSNGGSASTGTFRINNAGGQGTASVTYMAYNA